MQIYMSCAKQLKSFNRESERYRIESNRIEKKERCLTNTNVSELCRLDKFTKPKSCAHMCMILEILSNTSNFSKCLPSYTLSQQSICNTFSVSLKTKCGKFPSFSTMKMYLNATQIIIFKYQVFSVWQCVINKECRCHI